MQAGQLSGSLDYCCSACLTAGSQPDRVLDKQSCVAGSSGADHAPVSQLRLPDVAHDDREWRLLCLPNQTSCVGWQFSGKSQKGGWLQLTCFFQQPSKQINDDGGKKALT